MAKFGQRLARSWSEVGQKLIGQNFARSCQKKYQKLAKVGKNWQKLAKYGKS